MSSVRNVMTNCPVCGAEQEVRMWNSINVSLEPAEKEMVLSGEIFKFKCGVCGHEAPISYPILYHDMDRQYMIWLLTDEKEIATLNDDVPDIGTKIKGYRYRIVRNINELLDKIKVFDCGHDDREIEVMKCIMTLAISQQMPEEGIAGVYFNEGENREPCLFYLFENGKGINLKLDSSLLEKVKADYGKTIEGIEIKGFESIGFDWATAVMDEYSKGTGRGAGN